MTSSSNDSVVLRAWCTLIRTSGLGPSTIRRLLAHFKHVADVVQAGPMHWGKVLGQASSTAYSLPDANLIDSDLAWLDRPGHSIVPWQSDAYPVLLSHTDDAPVALFVSGDVTHLAKPQIAIIGSRNASSNGLALAHDFATTLAKEGFTITSGLAEGIDSSAHQAALEAHAPTIAVCGTGLDLIYPDRHRKLAKQIAEYGALVSEYPPQTPPRAFHFPRRNRIIAGLSLGTLVIEAGKNSGSLITARCASEYGRDVFALPGSIHNPLSRGCHQLIRDGAQLIEHTDEIINALAHHLLPLTQRPYCSDSKPWQALSNTENKPDRHASQLAWQTTDPKNRLIVEELNFHSLTLDELSERTQLPVAELAPRLVNLELEGVVVAQWGGRYLLKK
jgi:DNA processing protein